MNDDRPNLASLAESVHNTAMASFNTSSDVRGSGGVALLPAPRNVRVRTKVKAIWVLVTLSFLGFAGGVFLLGEKRVEHLALLRDHGVRTMGTVESKRTRRSSKSTYYYAQIRFTYPGGTVSKETSVGNAVYNALAENGGVVVTYDPKAPESFELFEVTDDTVNGARRDELIFVGIFFFIESIASVVLLIIVLRRVKLLREGRLVKAVVEAIDGDARKNRARSVTFRVDGGAGMVTTLKRSLMPRDMRDLMVGSTVDFLMFEPDLQKGERLASVLSFAEIVDG